jgi:UDP-N-acetylglucosamine 4-epimerase
MQGDKYHNSEISSLSFLVTGGAGFIGSHITGYLLRHGARLVRVIDNLSTGYEINLKDFSGNKHFEFFKGDIANPDDCNKACAGIDLVFHQAALGSVSRSIEFPLSTHQTNSTGFINMLVAARDAGAKKFIYASSSSVYGDEESLPKKENKTGNPLSPYAVTKVTNELYAANFFRTYGMKTIGLRYFNIFGPGQSPKGPYAAVIPLFIESMLTDKEIFIDGDGSQTRDFTYIDNAVQANIKAMFSDNLQSYGHVFNIAAGHNINLNQLVEIICKITGYTKTPQHRPPRKGDIRNSLADVSLAEKHFGYKPQVSVEEGLKKTVEWFRNK